MLVVVEPKKASKPFFGAKAAMLPMGGSRYSWIYVPPIPLFSRILKGRVFKGRG